MQDTDGGDNLDLEFSTKWSKGNLIKDDGEIGQLSIKGNAITFHIDGYGDVFARNFVGCANTHIYKVFTYGQTNADATGYFYRVSKVFLYNGNDYSDFSGDYISGIKSFSFEVPVLTQWLNIESVKRGVLEDKSIVVHEIPTPIFLLKKVDPHIYIKFETKDFLANIDNPNEKALKKVPRIFVEFSSPKDDQTVTEIIRIIMRFFSLLIGKISTVEDIRIDLEGKHMKMWLFLNCDFSVHKSWQTYWLRSRFKAENVCEHLQKWFEQWYSFSSDKSFTLLQDAYFQIYNKKTYNIEDIFLTFCRFIEGYDLRKSDDEKIAGKLGHDLIPVLSDELFRNALAPYFVKASSKYKPKYVAQWISSGFLERVGLDYRIRRIDKAHFSFIAENRDRICKGIESNQLYLKLSKTRNYYAHYKADKTGILELGEIYNALSYLEVLIISVLLSEMGIDEETRKNAFIQDELFWYHSTHLRPPEIGS